MKTMLKWPGGKESELFMITSRMPAFSGRYVEPFVGGGAVFFDQNAPSCCINDLSEELINFYRRVKERDADFENFVNLLCSEFASLARAVEEHAGAALDFYQGGIGADEYIGVCADVFSTVAGVNPQVFRRELLRGLCSKQSRSRKIESEKGALSDGDRLKNIESAVKSAYYMYVRHLFNHQRELSGGRQAAVFFFIREYCYSSMFRYNSSGEFNVPYGGISYNRKDFRRKIDYLFSPEMGRKLAGTSISCQDFEPFVQSLNLTPDDFMFLDPPYDTAFSNYANNRFGRSEQHRLAECLRRTRARFMLVIKNTDFIYNLYRNDFKIESFEKSYLVSFKNRNDQDVVHLIITNY